MSVSIELNKDERKVVIESLRVFAASIEAQTAQVDDSAQWVVKLATECSNNIKRIANKIARQAE